MNTLSLALAVTLLSAGAAVAQQAPCGGATPAVETVVHGPVLHVLDGRTLCVATGPDAGQWRPVTLADAPDDAAWGALMGVAFGKDVTCAAGVCRIGGRSIGDQLRDPAARKAGVTWRRPAERSLAPATALRMAAHS